MYSVIHLTEAATEVLKIQGKGKSLHQRFNHVLRRDHMDCEFMAAHFKVGRDKQFKSLLAAAKFAQTESKATWRKKGSTLVVNYNQKIPSWIKFGGFTGTVAQACHRELRYRSQALEWFQNGEMVGYADPDPSEPKPDPVAIPAESVGDPEPVKLEVKSDALSALGDIGTSIKDAINKAVASIEAPIPETFKVKINDAPVVEIEGVVHEQFDNLLKRVQVNPNIMLTGPSGSGKTFVCHQVAKALGRKMSSISFSEGTTEGHLLGRLIPTGEGGKFEYTPSEFVKCYTEGGVFVGDENDAANANCLLVLNQALANGHLTVPNDVNNPHKERHPDFVYIGCMNTLGLGRDRAYAGRNQLDAAFLRRFIMGTLKWDYSPRVERALCPDKELRQAWEKIRKAVKKNGMRKIVDTGSMADAFKMRQVLEYTVDDCVKQLTLTWTIDEKVACNVS